MKTEFFVTMIPPTTTHQQKKIDTRGKRPRVYEPDTLKSARAKLEAYLHPYAPEHPHAGAVQLVVKWCFPVTGTHRNGQYKTTRPDTDNLQKLLKDVMTNLGFWRDDALVVSEIVEKFFADIPGIFISIRELEE